MVLKMETMLIFINRSSEDNIDHAILSDKMKCIGFSDKTIKWFHFYLTNRAIFITLYNEFSEAGTINCIVFATYQ